MIIEDTGYAGKGESSCRMYFHAIIATGNMDVVIAAGCELMSKYTIMSDVNGTLHSGAPMGNPFDTYYIDKYGPPNQMVAAQEIADQWECTGGGMAPATIFENIA